MGVELLAWRLRLGLKVKAAIPLPLTHLGLAPSISHVSSVGKLDGGTKDASPVVAAAGGSSARNWGTRADFSAGAEPVRPGSALSMEPGPSTGMVEFRSTGPTES